MDSRVTPDYDEIEEDRTPTPSSRLPCKPGSIVASPGIKNTPLQAMITPMDPGTLYVGVTGDLPTRVEQHRSGEGSKFTSRYAVTRLVWFEEHDSIAYAIMREKTIKKWPRQWKINAIEALNPDWNDIRWQLF